MSMSKFEEEIIQENQQLQAKVKNYYKIKMLLAQLEIETRSLSKDIVWNSIGNINK